MINVTLLFIEALDWHYRQRCNRGKRDSLFWNRERNWQAL